MGVGEWLVRMGWRKMSYTDNPLADFDRYDEEQALREQDYPHCDYCGEVIYDHYYYICTEIVCEECLEEHFGREVEI